MDSGDLVRLTIDVDPSSDPVRGVFDDGRAAPVPFVGMLALIEYLEAARRSAACDGSDWTWPGGR